MCWVSSTCKALLQILKEKWIDGYILPQGIYIENYAIRIPISISWMKLENRL